MDWDWAKETQETKRFIQTSFEFRIVYFFFSGMPRRPPRGRPVDEIEFSQPFKLWHTRA